MITVEIIEYPESTCTRKIAQMQMEGSGSCTIHVPEDFGKTSCFIGEHSHILGYRRNHITSYLPAAKFSNGQLVPSSPCPPTISLYNKTKDATKKKKIIVS